MLNKKCLVYIVYESTLCQKLQFRTIRLATFANLFNNNFRNLFNESFNNIHVYMPFPNKFWYYQQNDKMAVP